VFSPMAEAPSSITTRASSIDAVCAAAPIRQPCPHRAARTASPSERHTTFPDADCPQEHDGASSNVLPRTRLRAATIAAPLAMSVIILALNEERFCPWPVPVPPRRHAGRFPVRRRRGSIWSALLGSLAIRSVSNGLDLMAQPPEIYYMVEGAILLVAVTLDALARRSRTATGC
jgi:hypothetical protein